MRAWGGCVVPLDTIGRNVRHPDLISNITTAREGSTNRHRNRGGSMVLRAGRGLDTRLLCPWKHIVQPGHISPSTDECFATYISLWKLNTFWKTRRAEKGANTSWFLGNTAKRQQSWKVFFSSFSSHPLYGTSVPLIRPFSCCKCALRISASNIFSPG